MPIDVIRSKIVIAGLSYVQPVFTADYLQIRVIAEVTMPDVLNVEVLTSSDLVSLTTDKNLADSSNTADYFLKSTNKGLFETILPIDVISTELVFIRAFEEFLSSPDAVALAAILNKHEALTVTDARVLSLSKALADTSSIVDMMDGDIQYLLIKVLSDFPSAIDAQIIDFSTEKADNIVTTSSGVLSMQDYSDITYFLEDYVGISTTFT